MFDFGASEDRVGTRLIAEARRKDPAFVSVNRPVHLRTDDGKGLSYQSHIVAKALDQIHKMPAAVDNLAAQLLRHLVEACINSPNVAPKRREGLTGLCVHCGATPS